MTHTPGPWKLQAGRSFKTSNGEFYLAYGTDRHGNALFKDFCELDANAHLIAAAPEMLEALQGMFKAEQEYFASTGHGKEAVAKALVHRVKANIIAEQAIAKAEGRQP